MKKILSMGFVILACTQNISYGAEVIKTEADHQTSEQHLITFVLNNIDYNPTEFSWIEPEMSYRKQDGTMETREASLASTHFSSKVGLWSNMFDTFKSYDVPDQGQSLTFEGIWDKKSNVQFSQYSRSGGDFLFSCRGCLLVDDKVLYPFDINYRVRRGHQFCYGGLPRSKTVLHEVEITDKITKIVINFFKIENSYVPQVKLTMS